VHGAQAALERVGLGRAPLEALEDGLRALEVGGGDQQPGGQDRLEVWQQRADVLGLDERLDAVLLEQRLDRGCLDRAGALDEKGG
jgi:hypothetical protein